MRGLKKLILLWFVHSLIFEDILFGNTGKNANYKPLKELRNISVFDRSVRQSVLYPVRSCSETAQQYINYFVGKVDIYCVHEHIHIKFFLENVQFCAIYLIQV